MDDKEFSAMQDCAKRTMRRAMPLLGTIRDWSGFWQTMDYGSRNAAPRAIQFGTLAAFIFESLGKENAMRIASKEWQALQDLLNCGALDCLIYPEEYL